MSLFSPEIPIEIFEFCLADLQIEDVFSVTQCNREFNAALENSQVWKIYLSRLEILDHFPILPETFTSSRLSCITALKNIHQKQQQEIQHFINYAKIVDDKLECTDQELSAIKALLAKLPTTNGAKTKLSDLEERDRLLNEINIAIIKTQISNSRMLIVHNLGITRFPDILLHDPALEHYWKNINFISFLNNKLQSLPHSLGKCVSLIRLQCQNNQLKTLPKSLGNCVNLVDLNCAKNRITKLPNTLSNCSNLQYLSCFDNKLRFIPINFKWKFKLLDYRRNNLNLEQELQLLWLRDKNLFFSAIALGGLIFISPFLLISTSLLVDSALYLIDGDSIFFKNLYRFFQEPTSHPLLFSILSIHLISLINLFFITSFISYLIMPFSLIIVGAAVTGLLHLNNYLANCALNKKLTNETEIEQSTFSNDLSTQKAFEDGCIAGRSWTSYFKSYCSINDWRHSISFRTGIINTYNEGETPRECPSV